MKTGSLLPVIAAILAVASTRSIAGDGTAAGTLTLSGNNDYSTASTTSALTVSGAVTLTRSTSLTLDNSSLLSSGTLDLGVNSVVTNSPLGGTLIVGSSTGNSWSNTMTYELPLTISTGGVNLISNTTMLNNLGSSFIPKNLPRALPTSGTATLTLGTGSVSALVRIGSGSLTLNSGVYYNANNTLLGTGVLRVHPSSLILSGENASVLATIGSINASSIYGGTLVVNPGTTLIINGTTVVSGMSGPLTINGSQLTLVSSPDSSSLPATVPEPGVTGLLILGLGAASYRRRRTHA